jgi:hypothetical protein
VTNQGCALFHELAKQENERAITNNLREKGFVFKHTVFTSRIQSLLYHPSSPGFDANATHVVEPPSLVPAG